MKEGDKFSGWYEKCVEDKLGPQNGTFWRKSIKKNKLSIFQRNECQEWNFSWFYIINKTKKMNFLPPKKKDFFRQKYYYGYLNELSWQAENVFDI